MIPEDLIKRILLQILPLKFDTTIKLTYPDKEETELALRGDVFTSKLKGETEDRIIIAIKIPGDD